MRRQAKQRHRSQICGVFSPTWNFPALSPRHPLTRADNSTHPPLMSPKQFLPQAGDVEMNQGPAPLCGVCRKSTTAKAVTCCTCEKSTHQSCSDMTRTMQKQWHQAIMTINTLTAALSPTHTSCATNTERASKSTTTGLPAERAMP